MVATFTPVKQTPVKQAKVEKVIETPKKEVPVTSYTPEVTINLSNLPSKGLPYPPHSQIKYRPFKMGMLKKVASSKLSDTDAVNMVLDHITTSFGSENLTMGDFYYLSFLVKIASLGSSNFEILHKCSSCEATVRKTLKTTEDFDFEDLSIPELPIKAEFSEHNLDFSPITVKSYLSLIKENKQNDLSWLMAAQCINKPLQEAFDIIENLMGRDFSLINYVDKLLSHSLKPIVLKCSCGAENTVELDGGQALILPFHTAEESVENRVHFGKRA